MKGPRVLLALAAVAWPFDGCAGGGPARDRYEVAPGDGRFVTDIRGDRYVEPAIAELLRREGAPRREAQEIVGYLRGKLSPREMHVWLAHRHRSHPVPDPESGGEFGVELDWTPVNAVAAGKARLVVTEARCFAYGDC